MYSPAPSNPLRELLLCGSQGVARAQTTEDPKQQPSERFQKAWGVPDGIFSPGGTPPAAQPSGMAQDIFDSDDELGQRAAASTGGNGINPNRPPPAPGAGVGTLITQPRHHAHVNGSNAELMEMMKQMMHDTLATSLSKIGADMSTMQGQMAEVIPVVGNLKDRVGQLADLVPTVGKLKDQVEAIMDDDYWLTKSRKHAKGNGKGDGMET